MSGKPTKISDPIPAELQTNSRQPAIPRRVHLPNFLPSTIPVLATILVAWWDKGTGDMVIAWFGIAMLVLLALTGLADIVANHYADFRDPAK